MNYTQTLEFLFQSLPAFETKGATAYKPGLERITAFCRHIGNPQRNFFTIHVAGTNGKGSVSHIIASVLQQAGYRTGLFTSPHLQDFRERIRVDGEMIPKQKVVNFVDKHHDKMVELELSFFEMTAALAFDYFAQSDVEVAVIETGLGGRLDATNIIVPVVSVITNIGLEHTTLLGDTLQAVKAHQFADPFTDPGEEDLTTHVDFSVIGNMARQAGRQYMVGGQVGVAVDQRLGPRGAQPGQGGRGIHVGIDGAAGLLARLALAARAAALGAALVQGARQQPGLPAGVARHCAKALVFHVVQAQRVAVRQQPAPAREGEHRGVGQYVDAGAAREARAHQEIAVAMHEVHRVPLCGARQQGAAFALEAARLGHGIVAHPDLEQVAEQEHRVGGRAVQVLPQRPQRGRLRWLQVQVGQEIDHAPAGWRGQLGNRRHGRVHGVIYSATALSITTASKGTSSWKPLRVVRTFLMLSTTSSPLTTLPNTA